MKKICFICLCLMTFACSSDVVEMESQKDADYNLLWGKWIFSYVTNTMIGERCYTFRPDGSFLYIDEWHTIDSSGNQGPSFLEKQEGTYRVVEYRESSDKTVEGEMLIDNRSKRFTITVVDANLIFLDILGNESFTKDV